MALPDLTGYTIDELETLWKCSGDSVPSEMSVMQAQIKNELHRRIATVNSKCVLPDQYIVQGPVTYLYKPGETYAAEFWLNQTVLKELKSRG